jgi:hypothetical protein
MPLGRRTVTERKMNPPIPGHELLFEGHTNYVWSSGTHLGGCRCGALPPEFPNLSVNAMKRWHREHKAALREQLDITSVAFFGSEDARRVAVRSGYILVTGGGGTVIATKGEQTLCLGLNQYGLWSWVEP